MKEVKEHFTSKALVGTGIVLLTVIIGVAVSNVWVTPWLARTVNGMGTTPPATA